MSNSKLIKYLKWLPAQLGIINKAAFTLGLNEIKKDDVFLVSFPKSGNTWLRFIIANLITSDELVTLQNIDQIVPDVYSSAHLVNAMSSKRFIKTHHAFFDCYPLSIYIYRDYRDAMVSNFHYFKNRRNFKGDFSEFLNSEVAFNDFGTWQFHLTSAFNQKVRSPNSILILRYEDLLAKPGDEIQKIIDFSGIHPKRSIEQVVKLCSFYNLKENENMHSGKYKKITGENFFRNGTSNQWKNYFSRNDLDNLMKKENLVNTMLRAGYTLS